MPDRPVVVVNARAVARLRAGHPWIYRSDVVSAEGAGPGALAEVKSERRRSLGTAFYSTASEIALRLLAPVKVENLAELVQKRVRGAVEYRRKVVRDTDAYRVVFSEADELPGLIVDRYNDVLVLEALTQATDDRELKHLVVAELAEQFAPAGIVERAEPRIRQLEQLPPSEGGLVYGNKTETVFSMNGVHFHQRALAGQKTGAFLDQRENYAAAAAYAHGEALDVFCYQGGFALHLARVCAQVTAVDSSRPALEQAEQNAVLNPGLPEIEWIEANAFDLLKDYAAAGRQYDTIVLDPPAFARSRRALQTALRGYKELNLRALKMLRPGGILVTCSCSYHVGEGEFVEMLASAAVDAHRSVRILEKRGQSKDHPVVLTIPETSYLKCVIVVVNN
ncbi:MAG TPA: class I SAM-dependent rRNA methyltransferase [Terriglobales bacterium]|jgi:23S rRNA (cytosine1962-C5)-methyltransferase|nr:class I SAM-dependent rRNA methyltransferase [Terriglobales bacterium]